MYDPKQNNIQGWMSEPELLWLYEKSLNKAVVEVGSWKGRSTHAIASAATKLYCVDHFKGSPNELTSAHQEATTVNIRDEFDRNIKDFNNITVIAMDSKEASKFICDNTVDVVFIDGTHTTEALVRDIDAWLPKLKPDGLLCGHDAVYPEVKRALNQMGFEWGVSECENIWVRR